MARLSKHKRGLALARKYGFVSKRGVVYRKVPGRGLVKVRVKRHRRGRKRSEGIWAGHGIGRRRRMTAKARRASLRNLKKARRALKRWQRDQRRRIRSGRY